MCIRDRPTTATTTNNNNNDNHQWHVCVSQQNVGADGRAHARVSQKAKRKQPKNKQQTTNSKQQKNKEQSLGTVSGRFGDSFGTVSGRFRDGFEVGKYRDGSRDAFGTKAEFSPEENQRSERYLREHLGIRSPALLAYPRVALPPCPRTLEYLCRSKPPYGSANFGGSPVDIIHIIRRPISARLALAAWATSRPADPTLPSRAHHKDYVSRTTSSNYPTR